AGGQEKAVDDWIRR
ncbi:unnamed protein product, partial [Allacma fusca]